jgi:MFS transporter, ACS family, hexuronate transporter
MSVLTPRLRWIIFGILCLASISNAMDRQIIAILKADMSHDLKWDDNDYGSLAAWFQGAAAVAFLFTGWIVDRLGVKRGNSVGVAAWSIAAMAHGWAVAMWEFIVCRVALGATEAMGTPLTIKTVATVFPPDQRSFAFGLSTLVGAIGLIGMPFLIPYMASHWGWRGAFIAAGLIGFLIIAAWIVALRGVTIDSSAEADAKALVADNKDYGPILTESRTWAIAGAKTLSDATWWLLLYWLPDFFGREFGLKGINLALPLAIAYCGSGGGAFFAGWISMKLSRAGWSVNRVRKTVMLVSALIVLPVPIVLQIHSFWPVAIMMAVVLAGHQGFSLSLFSIITDVVPRSKVGRVTAFGAFAGNLGGMAIAKIAGLVLVAGLGYTPLFMFAAVSYLLALGWLQLLMPVVRRVPGAGGAVAAAH